MNQSTSFKQARQHRRKWLLLFLSWLIVLTLASLCRNPGIKTENWFSQLHFDKLGHFTFYAVLFYLYLKSFLVNWPNANVFIGGIIFCVCYGILMEYLQSITSTDRQADVLDIFANTFGVLIVAFYFYKKKRHDMDHIKHE